jgi:predicted phosphodiesterase
MKIQIVSDLHLEFRGKDVSNILVPSAPILCMVGDICVCGSAVDFNKFINFLTYYTPKFLHILHVSGNHEYYTANNATAKDLAKNTIPEIDKKLRMLTKEFPNYHYLNNNIWNYTAPKTKHNYVFVGTTLWTHIPNKMIITDEKKGTKEKLASLIEQRMNDYNYIFVPIKDQFGKSHYRKYTVSDMKKKHAVASRFIKNVIADAKKSKPTNTTYILLTHHKPLFDKKTDILDEHTYAYESDLAEELLVEPFVLAAHGHTHVHYDKRVNGVRVVSNPKGYIGESTNFNDKFTVLL